MDHDAPPEAVCAFNVEISIYCGEPYKLHVIAVPRVRGQPIYVFFLATPSFATRDRTVLNGFAGTDGFAGCLGFFASRVLRN
ncbi:hypothetical protein [Paraburkholderia sp. MM5384-R2]|uniref:hypothetical protein n=1 Tax=Paraburkholderia sp. MM5384-R2 TaxID=2723097 RepID=UPI0016182026|nr:hypothetical protein [Paraburkholderia sp. MM5384-R2]MBB5502618.1 hypothetical protein [Paraburkholderia sp. MM5384-R2]